MQAFEGIRVLDFTHVYTGPFAGFQLAVMGADVIKLEAPGRPDQMRGEGVDEALNRQGLGCNYYINNQGKKAVTLNLEDARGREIAAALIQSADVLLENYSGLLRRYGLGPKSSLELNPRLIYCEMSGYGRDNPMAGRPAYDPVIQAASGMMSVNGNPDQEYLRVGPPLVDYGMGAQTAFAIASALFQRERSGKGQIIDANMLDAALMMMSPLVANAVHAGQTDRRSGNRPIDRAGYSVFPCRDVDIMIGAFTLKQHRVLFDLLEIEQAIEIPDDIDFDWLRDHGPILREKITEALAVKDANQWELLLNEFDVPAARVRDLYEMLSSDQPGRAAHSQIRRFDNADFGAPIAAFRFADHGPRLDSHCAVHGEDNREVYRDLGYDDEALEKLAAAGVI